MWDDQVPVLAPNHRVIRYDLRFHGRSDSQRIPFSDMEDLAVLMDSLDIPTATLVGLSLGGQVAMDLALTHPDRVASLVLVGPGLPGFPLESPEIIRHIEALTAAMDGGNFDEMEEVFIRGVCVGPFRESDELDPEVRSKILTMMKGSRARWGFHELIRPLDPPTMERVGEITAPTLLVLGLLDVPEMKGIVTYLNKQISNSRRVEIPSVAHMVNLEAPERVNEVLLEFLQGGP
jgi:pimeloyl-ACP methyl ester carboxylesterase